MASAEYRLNSEAPFPAPYHDIQSAIRFLRTNASEYYIILKSSVYGAVLQAANLQHSRPPLATTTNWNTLQTRKMLHQHALTLPQYGMVFLISKLWSQHPNHLKMVIHMTAHVARRNDLTKSMVHLEVFSKHSQRLKTPYDSLAVNHLPAITHVSVLTS